MTRRDTTIDVHSQDDSDETFDLHTTTTPGPRRAVTRTETTDKTFDNGAGPWLSGGPYKYPVPQKGDPWGKCYKKVKKYDDDMCDGWRGEVDNLIVFAGLFSAAVTTFVIESYQQLQEDPNDRNSFILEQILVQVHNSNGPNSPLPVPLTPPVFTPSATSVRVNIFWFMSLSLSLATVFVGILCMQWLREYQRDSPLDPQDAISLRQLRYEGLMAWKVPDILMSLPVLLHASLILFFAGLIDLLWSINKAVALAVSVVSGAVLLFLLTTTLLPSCQLYFITDNQLRKPQCAYKSPQSWAIHRFITKAVKFSNPVTSPFRTPFRVIRYKPFFEDKDWVDYDKHWQDARNKPHASQANTDIVNGLAWIDKHLGQTVDMAFAMYHCIKEMSSAASVHVVSQINERIKDHLSSSPMADYLPTANEDERREIHATLFLETNKHSFPQLDQFQLESVIRILNTRLEVGHDQAHPEIVQIQDSLPFIRWPLQYIRGLPEDLITQFLSCIKNLITQGHMKADYEEEIWALVQLILSSRDAHSSHKSHVKLAFEIMAAFEEQLPWPKANNAAAGDLIAKDVRACALHVIRAWPPGECRDLAPYVGPVLSAIRIRMDGVGGVDSILSPEDRVRWDDMTDSIGMCR